MKRLLRWLRKWSIRVALAVITLTIALTLPLRWLDPPVSAFMLVHRLSSEEAVQYQWLPINRISPELALAVIAAEDQNFPHHHGFDLREIHAAVQTHRRGGRLRGASTISQQLARNLYLWPHRSWFRKGLEFWFTVPLELFLPKQRILELYLNVAEFGPGLYGAEAAARHHFGKPASELTRAEAALLAAVLPAPKRLDASRPGDYLLERQRWIIRQMNNLGYDWVP
ncbi:monofunctional biosynthetic peptidoglycan transglycosylase [Wenzhouxiangella sp. AB-CW3]|uniref:monofunctional biosynthetic peptidoglycan transglycosylase n=1 Tax=Wenzhouxiangella sp. AB-CW3 TaxID=2771012 RepID=UPI00168AF69C|nr:monofunctional biosynthetic peptidoglycan transglycosylase [Wenzhouxiangella sp. AB-CW3]QOC21094.1 monofunctional biosynthetic peptidoglycan transglycosylase [Wenzhouxiangella sp. AB-CW3]